MARLLAAPFVLLAFAACMHNPVPIQTAAEPEFMGPLEARIHVSHFGGLDLTVDLSRPAHIAVFEVVPGSGTALLYPRLGQPALMDAGRNYPHILAGALLRNASGSAYDWAARGVTGWRSSSHSWMQPRHIFLVASEMPLSLDGLHIWASRGVGVLTHPTFASFSAQATMGHLLDVVLPSAAAGQWTTDVFTIWPEPPAMNEGRRFARTQVPVWLSCNGNVVFHPAGTPLDIVRAQLMAGCTIVDRPKTASDSTSTEAKPAPDTTAGSTKTPPANPRNPRAEPVRPRMPREAVLDPGTRRDVLDDGTPNRDAMARALVRAGGRAYRPGDVASERGEIEREENDAQARFRTPANRDADREARTTRPGMPGSVSSPAPSSERARGSQVERTREQSRATPSRPRPVERARVEPTRTRERSMPATERPSASERRRPQADPPRRTAPVERKNPPAAAPARTAPPRAERPATPPPKAEPKETKPPREVPPA